MDMMSHWREVLLEWHESDWYAVLREVLVLLTSVVIAALRIGGAKSASYQALAHLFLGGLGVSWMTGWRWFSFDALLFWLLCVVEAGCFLAGRFS
jgi:hypothetical protein